MSATLVELTAGIVSAHASGSSMSSDDLIKEINLVYSALKQLESGEVPAGSEAKTAEAPVISLKKAFQNDQVTCMICGKSGFKTLTRHLRQAHDMKPGQYRKQFNIPAGQSLTARNYSEKRRNLANANNLAANLEKARAVRAANSKSKSAAQKPAKKAAAPKKAAKPKGGKGAKP